MQDNLGKVFALLLACFMMVFAITEAQDCKNKPITLAEPVSVYPESGSPTQPHADMGTPDAGIVDAGKADTGAFDTIKEREFFPTSKSGAVWSPQQGSGFEGLGIKPRGEGKGIQIGDLP